MLDTCMGRFKRWRKHWTCDTPILQCLSPHAIPTRRHSYGLCLGIILNHNDRKCFTRALKSYFESYLLALWVVFRILFSAILSWICAKLIKIFTLSPHTCPMGGAVQLVPFQVVNAFKLRQVENLPSKS